MKLLSIIILSSIGCSNAQIVRPFFNSVISPLLTGAFSDILQSALSEIDPLAIGFTSSLDIDTPTGCSGDTTASFTISEISNISTASLDTFRMTSFCFSLPSFGIGMLVETSLPSLIVSMEGNMTTSDSSCGPIAFSGSAGITDATFNFGFDASMSISTSFTFAELNITAFEFNWTSIDVELENLGLFESVADDVENLLNDEVKNAVLGVVNRDLLQDVIDTVIPFSVP